MEHIGKVLQKQNWYQEAQRHRFQWWKHAGLTAGICLAIVVISAAPLYHISMQSPEKPNHFPVKTVEELLDAIRPQIVDPDLEK